VSGRSAEKRIAYSLLQRARFEPDYRALASANQPGGSNDPLVILRQITVTGARGQTRITMADMSESFASTQSCPITLADILPECLNLTSTSPHSDGTVICCRLNCILSFPSIVTLQESA
jgi:hypothetical protein